MSKKSFLFLAVALVGVVNELHGQVSPPSFQCVKGDTLIWSPEINNCGPFIALDIFRSDTREGPYSLVISLADRATTRYVDDSQSGTRFYYLVYRHDCPGEPSISSDTLDNRSPVVTK
ncbi:MAG: hypothetical protein OEQ53_06430, partial [Saprospiraceae bacterium]|nr:hypothetical protein [Saprospiraceae bacterium]